MLETLRQIEEQLPKLIENRAAWKSLDVDYEPPRVERVWREVELDGTPYRVCLHRIHPCERALMHPHPWPSAMRVVDGSYEMIVGHGGVDGMSGTQGYHKTATLILTKGAAYEMVDMDGWHNVRPVGNVAYSLMVMGPRYVDSPFDHSKFGAGQTLKSLPKVTEDELLGYFWSRYHEGV